jgi:hypothetical protein
MRKSFSRKGAKAQRKDAEDPSALTGFFFLCVFASLREKNV